MPARLLVRHCFRRFWKCCVAFGLSAIAASSWAQMLVVLSDDSASYREVAAEMQAGLKFAREGRLRIDVVTAERVPGIDEPSFKAYELVVTVGLSAAQAVLASERALATPPLTLCLMIPRQAYERVAASRAGGRERRVSAVFIDQPLSTNLEAR